MDFSAGGIMAAIIFGLLGMWVFREGKRNENIPVVIIGIGLMAYPYFVSGALASWGVGVALCGAAYYFW